MNTLRRSATSLALLVAVVAGLLVQSVATAGSATTTVVSGRSRGQAVQVSAPPNTSVHLAKANSEVNSSGIGGGANVANGTAKPAEVIVGGVTTLRAADSATSAPPGGTDSDGVPNASVPGLLTAKNLDSASSADTTPRSSNSARVEEATVLGTVLKVGVIYGSADSRRAGDDSLGSADAYVANASVTVTGLAAPITIVGAQASASAVATGINPPLPGGSKGTVSSCTVAQVKVGSANLLNIPCNGAELSPVPGLVSIKAGLASTSATATTASAKVDALTIFIPLTKQTIILGAVEIIAAVDRASIGSPCVFPARPTANGSAQGDVVRTNDLLTKIQTDVALSDVKIDEAGVNGSPYGAKADAMIGQVQQPTLPLLTQVVDTHATAPPPSSQSATVADVSIGSLLSSQTAKTNASANANADRTAPQASADATAERAGVNAGSLVGLASTTVASDASSKRNPGNVTSAAHASVESLTATVAGLPLSVQALKSSANASATGAAGGAAAATTFQVARVQLGSLVIDATPPAGTKFEVLSGLTLVRLTFGVVSTATQPDGTAAKASADALVIEVLPGGGGSSVERIVISHSEAGANVPKVGAGAFISKDIDVQFDETPSFGDSPATVAPGQKFTYRFCYANTGTTTLSNVVISDVLDSHLLRPYEQLFPFPPNVTIIGGTPVRGTTLGGTLSTAPFTLAPGETGSFSVVLEVYITTPVGTVINNTATLSATQLPQSVSSNNVVINVGFSPNSPRLSATVLSTSFNSATRQFTVTFSANNAVEAGPALSARVVTIATKPTSVTLLNTFPILLGDISPGGSAPFTVTFFIPGDVSAFNYDILFAATGSDGHRYLFD